MRTLLLIFLLVFSCQSQMLLPIVGGTPAVATWTTARSYATDTYNTDGATRNHREVVKANTLAAGGTSVRVTFAAGNTGSSFVIGGASICLMTTAPTCDATPTRFTFSSSNGVTIPINTTAVTDSLTFSIDKTKQYGITFYTTYRNFIVDTSSANIDNYFDFAGGGDATVSTTLTDPGLYTNYWVAITKIEVQ
jgi:hypothetical protein